VVWSRADTRVGAGTAVVGWLAHRNLLVTLLFFFYRQSPLPRKRGKHRDNRDGAFSSASPSRTAVALASKLAFRAGCKRRGGGFSKMSKPMQSRT